MSIALTFSIVLCAVAWLTFVIWYTLRAKWWKKSLGWNTFGVSAFLVLLVGRLALIRLTGDEWDFVASGVVVYLLGTGLAVQRIIYMERAQREVVE